MTSASRIADKYILPDGSAPSRHCEPEAQDDHLAACLMYLGVLISYQKRTPASEKSSGFL